MLNVNGWRAWMQDHDRAQTTIMRYEQVIQKFAARVEDDVLTPTDVREWREELARQGYAASAINLYLAALRSYGAWLVASGQAHANPAAQARLQKEQAIAPRWLTNKEQAALTRTVDKMILENGWSADEAQLALRNRAMIWMMLYCGLRVGELCALQTGDVVIREKSGLATVRDGKGGKRRAVPVPLPARRALQEWLAHRPADTPSLFGVSERMAQRIVLAAADRAHIACTPHTLRHTYAHNLRVAGVGIEKIAALMGHDRLSTTMRYTLPSAGELAEAVSVLE